MTNEKNKKAQLSPVGDESHEYDLNIWRLGSLSPEEYQEYLRIKRKKWTAMTDEERERWQYLKQGLEETVIIRSPIYWGTNIYVKFRYYQTLLEKKLGSPRKVICSAKIKLLGLDNKGRKRVKNQYTYRELVSIRDAIDEALALMRARGYCRKFRYGRYKLEPFDYQKDGRHDGADGDFLPGYLEQDYEKFFNDIRKKQVIKEGKESGVEGQHETPETED